MGSLFLFFRPAAERESACSSDMPDMAVGTVLAKESGRAMKRDVEKKEQ